jgi:serine phosphatase RsbU (regulator of sigma subunit)
LWLLRNNQIIEIKADRHSVGYNYGAFRQFTQHTLSLQKKDRIYTFSDGYPDQFGGDKKKKFKNRNLQNLLLAIYNLPAIEQKRLVKLTFDNWKGTEEQVDDVLLMGLLL